MGESRTTLWTVLGAPYPSGDGHGERKKVQFCLTMAIIDSHRLPVKLYMKL